jgi:hypothetical protein
MFRNVATKIAVFAFDTATSLPKSGDAANITAYVAKDYGTTTVLADSSATEQDATNAKGWYLFDVAQGETDGDALLFSGKSSTAGIVVVGMLIFTTPNRFTTLVIDAAGLADSTSVKMGPSGSAAAQTARDIGASVLLSTGTGTGQLDFTAGVVKANLAQILGTALTESAGQIAAAFKKFFNIATPASTMDALTLVATATNLTNAPTAGDFTATMKTSIGTAVAASAVASVTGNVGGNVTGSVGSVVGAVGSVTGAVGSVTGLTASDVGAIKTQTDKLAFTVTNQIDANVIDWKGATAPAMTGDAFARLGAPAGASVSADIAAVKSVDDAVKLKTDNLPSDPADASDIATAFGVVGTAISSLSIPTAAAISDAVWDEDLSGHAVSGSTGEALASAGTGGDPWGTALPGAYGAGTAGQIIGDFLDAQVSSVPSATDNADAVLNRDMASVSDTNDRTLLNAIRALRNRWSTAGATHTVYKEDDTSVAWTAPLDTAPTGDVITGADPV